MSSPLKVPYSAQWVGCTQQIELLRANGIIVNDAPSAEKFLSHTSYSRFKGYWSAFADASGRCTVGTTFEKVRGCYEFDLGLRDVISDAFGIIEIDLRASVSHFFGKKYGCFGHTGQTNFFTPPIKANGSQTGFIHADWQKKMRKDAADSKETFVRRFFSKYEGEDLPIWLACEIMTFGSLAMMVGGMHPVDRNALAVKYGLTGKHRDDILSSWAGHLSFLRNICAHHARLWNRPHTIRPMLPGGRYWRYPFVAEVSPQEKVATTLLIVYHMIRNCHTPASFKTNWKGRVFELLKSPPTVSSAAHDMGVARSWWQHTLWDE